MNPSTSRRDDWPLAKLGRVLRLRNGMDYKDVETEDPEAGYPVFGSGGVFRYATEFLYDGESVLFGRKGTIDRPQYVNGRFWTVDTMFYSEISKELADAKFLFYWATQVPYGKYTTSTALPSMTQADLHALELRTPPLEEQRAIADFLDRETAEIDAFIADQERLIELLTERRTATITHAVSNYFKDDTHPSRLNMYLFESDSRRGTDNVPLYSVSINHGVVPWKQLFDKEPRAEDLSGYRYVEPGDIVLNRMRAFQGGIGVSPEPCCVSPDYAVLKCREGASADLIVQILKSERGLHEIRKRLRGIGDESSGAVRTPRINVKDLLDIRLELPTFSKQADSTVMHARILQETDESIADAKQAIELSKERRAVLISAAVTGQIDVRTHG